MTRVSYVTVACMSDKRWFDLDAVRHEHRSFSGQRIQYNDHGEGRTDRNDFGTERYTSHHPAGAPPLDWWDETDTPQPPPGEPMTTSTVTLHIGDVRDIQAQLADASVDLVVTSPPFLALRSYLPADHPDKHREIGSEPTPAEYLDTLLELTDEWRRLLTATGSLAVEIGDTYSGSGGGDAALSYRMAINGERSKGGRTDSRDTSTGWPLPKSLCGIPTLYTWSLAYGHNLLNPAHRIRPWRVRNLLTWTRPNPPVGALGDKFRPATSFVTVACDSDKRWFDLDAVRTPVQHPEHRFTREGETRRSSTGNWQGFGPYDASTSAGAPPLDWQDDDQPDWQPLHNLPTHPYKGAHYATFNPALPRRLIEAMCPREVCRVCGEPRRRVTQATDEYIAVRGVRGFSIEDRRGNDSHIPAAMRSNGRGGPTARHDTLGWSNCDCEIPGKEVGPGSSQIATGQRLRETVVPPPSSPEWTDCKWRGCDWHPDSARWRPGIVYDPFGGSGTTAIAAATVGRDTILCDLDARNVDLIRQRISENFRIVDEVVDGDTYRWTVTPASKQEVANIAAGQETLW